MRGWVGALGSLVSTLVQIVKVKVWQLVLNNVNHFLVQSVANSLLSRQEPEVLLQTTTSIDDCVACVVSADNFVIGSWGWFTRTHKAMAGWAVTSGSRRLSCREIGILV